MAMRPIRHSAGLHAFDQGPVSLGIGVRVRNHGVGLALQTLVQQGQERFKSSASPERPRISATSIRLSSSSPVRKTYYFSDMNMSDKPTSPVRRRVPRSVDAAVARRVRHSSASAPSYRINVMPAVFAAPASKVMVRSQPA